MKALALITARGGSKRIPRKNIKNFFGKPIMSYPIEAALSKIFDKVMVSTDDRNCRYRCNMGPKCRFQERTKFKRHIGNS